MKRAVLVLLSFVLMIGCAAEKQSAAKLEHEKIIRADLLSAQPGDLVENESGLLLRLSSPVRDNGIFMEAQLDYPGMRSGGEVAIYPKFVKWVYHYKGRIETDPGFNYIRNPEREAWKEAAERYVLQGVTPSKVARK